MNTFEMDCMRCPRLWTKASMIFNCIWTTRSLKSIPFFEQIMVNWNKNCLIPWISQEWLSRTDWLSCLRQLLLTTWLKLFRVSSSVFSFHWYDTRHSLERKRGQGTVIVTDLSCFCCLSLLNRTRHNSNWSSCPVSGDEWASKCTTSSLDGTSSGEKGLCPSFQSRKERVIPLLCLSFFSIILRLYRSLTFSCHVPLLSFLSSFVAPFFWFHSCFSSINRTWKEYSKIANIQSVVLSRANIDLSWKSSKCLQVWMTCQTWVPSWGIKQQAKDRNRLTSIALSYYFCFSQRRKNQSINSSFCHDSFFFWWLDTLSDNSAFLVTFFFFYFWLNSNISALLQADIVHEVQRGKDAFDRVGNKIQSAVNDSIPDIKRQIHAVGDELSKTAKEINDILKVPTSDIRSGKESVSVGGEYIEKYEKFRWYACLGASGIILTILACYTLGLLNGVCGNQPTVNDYRNRRQKPPSTWLLSLGIFLLFFFFGFLLLATVGLFFVGGVTDRVGCYFLEHPDDASTQKLVSLIEKHFKQLSSSDSLKIIHGQKPNIADVLSRCHQNVSLYHALQLNKFNRIQVSPDKVLDGFNISSILEFKNRYQIEERLNTFLSRVDVNPAPIVILTREGNELLDKLKETSLGTLNFSSFADLVNQVREGFKVVVSSFF